MSGDCAFSDERRLRTLRSLQLLDTSPEAPFDKLTRVAARVLAAPVAVVSLVDAHRLWIKSSFGLSINELPRRDSFCDHAIRGPHVLVVEDAALDERFARHTLVCDAPFVRFYAGAPLTTREGARIGTLSVLDVVPRSFSREQTQILEDLAGAVMESIELRQVNRARGLRDKWLAMAEDVALVGHWRWDTNTDELFWSPQIFKIHGLEQTSSAPKLSAALAAYHGEDGRKLREALQHAAKSRSHFDLIVRLARPDGALRKLRMQGRFHAGDTEMGDAVIGTLQDLTEVSEFETRLANAERMAAIGTLAAGIAHEVNNPLSYVIANTDLVLEELERLNEMPSSARMQHTKERVREVRDGARRIHEIVKGLTAFARANTNRHLDLELGTLLDMAIRLSSHELRHRAALKRDFSATTPRVRGDAAQLIQVAVSLIVNAAQAIPRGHQSDHAVCIACGEAASGDAFFSVTDSGEGMSAPVLDQAFSAFFSRRGGAGLGLTIAQGIVKAHGGRIEMTSAPERGTTVRVVLPGLHASAQAGDSPAPPPVSKRRLRVLIVDDDHLVAQALGRLLREHDVTTIEDAPEALAHLLEGARYDAILCDLMMPNLSGRELYEALLDARPETAKIMVFISGGSFDEADVSFASNPNIRILDKPVDPRDLRHAVLRIAGEPSST